VRDARPSLSDQETRTLAEFGRHFSLTFKDESLLKLALTHRSYLSVTGQGPRESNERLEFLGDSVLGLVTSEYLYRQNPNEHEGQLTKTKSLLVSKAILSRRALAMGLGRFVLMSHSEVESGGRQRLSILADAFEAVLGAIYLDQGFEAARAFIHRWLLKDSQEIASDKRHANWKSHLQEYVQSTFHTHPVYRVRSEMGPDHSKVFMVDVMVGKRLLGSGKGRNKKDAEQAAARNALDQVGATPADDDAAPDARGSSTQHAARDTFEQGGSALLPDSIEEDDDAGPRRRRGRRGGRGQRTREFRGTMSSAELEPQTREPVSESRGHATEPTMTRRAPEASAPSRPPRRSWLPPDEENEEIGRPEGPLEERHVDVYDWEPPVPETRVEPDSRRESPPHAQREFEREESANASRDLDPEVPRAREKDALREEEAGEFEPRAGTLFSHEGVESTEPNPRVVPATPPARETPTQYGRRSSRSRPGSRR
jgi:ribonuclease III